ncbi:hypothetical protein N7488_011672 [Penicillium malachiteum]|nr:hypothetical protein N7488_011672 [Penicillium malachiteum]
MQYGNVVALEPQIVFSGLPHLPLRQLDDIGGVDIIANSQLDRTPLEGHDTIFATPYPNGLTRLDRYVLECLRPIMPRMMLIGVEIGQ